jgi:hypothetical protein
LRVSRVLAASQTPEVAYPSLSWAPMASNLARNAAWAAASYAAAVSAARSTSATLT